MYAFEDYICNSFLKQKWWLNYLFELGIDLASNLVLDVVNVGAS